jgi:DNA topoisomerase-1
MLPTEGPAAAKAAGLRYTTDATPGIRRVKKRSTFAYIAADGSPVTDRNELARIAALAVPPAYVDVWISPIANGHLQATGRDARGRKQYRYHKRWRAVRDETKFDRMVAFAKALPAIRGAVDRDLKRTGLPREKILATVVSLLEETSIRVGNEEYARDNDSYGLTTLEPKHVSVTPTTISFHFRGKSGKEHAVKVRDRRIARIVKASRDLPGQKLFEYLDDAGEPHPVHSDDVNAYLREIAGDDFSAKDFRTWEATMRCALELAAVRVEGAAEAKAAVVEAIKRVAEKLGNTPAVCKKSYIHPGVIEAFLADGALTLVAGAATSRGPFALDRHERSVVALVESIAEREHQPLAKLLTASVRAASPKRQTGRRPRRPREQPHRSVGAE